MKFINDINVGLVRNINQDSIFSTVSKKSGIFVVADGMGGHADGEYASAEVTSACKFWWENSFNENMSFEEAVEGIQNAVLSANDIILRHARNSGKICGTTVAILFVHNDVYASMNIGDSRIYLIRKGVANQISFDHTVNSMEAVRGIPEEEFSPKDELLQAIGTREKLKWHCVTDAWKSNDRFFICSDGVYRYADEKKLFSTLKSNISDNEKKLEIIKLVETGGAKDNFSYALVSMPSKISLPKLDNEKMISAVIIAVAVIVVGALFAVKVSSLKDDNVATSSERFSLGQRYLIDLDYKSAVMEFEAVIDIEPKNADAYIGLADAYIGLGDEEKAKEVLQKGFEETGNRLILDKLDELSVSEVTTTPEVTITPEATTIPEVTTTEVTTEKKETKWIPIKETEYNYENKIISTTDYDYDFENNRVDKICNSDTGRWIESCVFDSEFNIVRIFGITGMMDYEYDDRGNIIKEMELDENGTVYWVCTYEYDSLNRMTKKSYDSDYAKYTITYEYDSMDRVIKETHYDKSGIKEYDYFMEYDSIGNLSKKSRYESDKLKSYTIYTYKEIEIEKDKE